MALSLIGSEKIRTALDLGKEPLALRDSYGMTLFGQSCLAARRLVEAGSRFVTVFWDEYGLAGSGWDTHWDHYPRMRDELLPGLDRAWAGLIADLVIDAKQGISGAGRAFDESTHLSMAGENILAYKVAEHRHTPEIEEQLTALLGAAGVDKAPKLLFQAHLVPLDQGELADCYLTTTRPVSDAELGELFAAAYEHEPFVEVVGTPPGTRDVQETNFCRIFAKADPHSGKVIVLSALDNLWKGTSSQAVQNLNLMFGFPETWGLT